MEIKTKERVKVLQRQREIHTTYKESGVVDKQVYHYYQVQFKIYREHPLVILILLVRFESMAFELWETLKESILVYTGLSLLSFFTLAAFGLALSYVFWLFGSSPQPKKHHSSSDLKQDVVVKDMALVPMDTASYSVSTRTGLPSTSWNVFLSFYGKDTRRNFISHLYHALDQAGVETFKDEPALEKGEEISAGLRSAINNSKMFVVVISENYAYSSWCLDELVEILSCKKTKNQVVPVFYYVDPSDLRHQKRRFGEALKMHKKRYSLDTIKKWKSALTEIANLSGYHLKEDTRESEADTIQKIVEKVVPRSSKKVLHLESYLVGIDVAVEEIYQKLSMESNDVRALGICGMGGIGKTTTAKAFYNKHSHKFDTSCFVENVKQYSQGGSPLLPLLQQILIELLRNKDYKVRDVESALRILKEILSSNKALIVLDDLDQSSYSELLVRICKLFSDGSRVIITARDANLANQLKVEMSQVHTYLVKPLEHNDSVKLFSYHTFKKAEPPRKYTALSESFLTHVGGHPLALKVLGSSLCGRTDASFWKAKLEKIQKNPGKEIEEILQQSYDELDDETEKAIFLDIVFFFIGKDKDEAVDVFKSCDFFPEAGIPILVERCLLTIDVFNRLQMHNLIQNLGKKIIREESKHGKCQRLYLNQEEACQTVQNLEGTEGLILDFTTSSNKYCNAEIFARLPNLRLLELIDVHDIRGNFNASLSELRCITWHGCPWLHLPSDIHLQKLVILDVPFSRFKTLWKDAKLPSLLHLNLDGCKFLEELPESVGQLTKLERVNMRDCVSLKRMPKLIVQLTSLRCLKMSGCSNLKSLPDQLGDMKGLQVLDASWTAIEQLPDSIAHLKKLIHLNLLRCEELRKLPEQFGNMEGLQGFDACESGIEQLPDSFSNLINLVDLTLRSCKNLTSLPNSIWKLKRLQHLDVSYCVQLKRLPEQLGGMQCLQRLFASNAGIEELPDSIGMLPRIRSLNFSGCKELTYVPNSIHNLTSLERLYLSHVYRRLELPDAVNYMKLEDMELSCNVREWLPMIISFSCLKKLSLNDECGSPSPTKPFSFFKLFNLERLVLTNCTSHGSSFPELPLNLKYLKVDNHTSLEEVPDLSNLKQLKHMNIWRCTSLESLQKLPPHLVELTVRGCRSLQHLPDLSMLEDLKSMVVDNNGSTLEVDIKDIILQLRGDKFRAFEACLQNKEIPEWLDYKSSGCTLSFDIPSTMGENLVGIALWVVLTSYCSRIKAVIINTTQGTTNKYHMWSILQGVSRVRCFNISIKSGDQIQVSFEMFPIIFSFEMFPRISSPVGRISDQIKMCGAHLL